MKFNQEIGKQFANVSIGVTKNEGQGTELMRNRYNANLRNKPVSPEEHALNRQNKILRDALKKAQNK